MHSFCFYCWLIRTINDITFDMEYFLGYKIMDTEGAV